MNSYAYSLSKAIKSEEKQGCINSGALGSFSSFLLELLPCLQGLISEEQYEKTKSLAEAYDRASPRQRKEMLAQLKANFQDLWQELDNEPNLIKGPAAEGSLTQRSAAKESATNDPVAIIQVAKESATRESAVKASAAKGSVADESAGKAQASIEPDHSHPYPANSGSLQYVKGVGPQRAKQFAHLGINTIPDLLQYFPRRYEIRKKRSIAELKDDELATITGTVTGSQVGSGRIKVVKLNIEQDGRNIVAIWFNQAYIAKQYPPGTVVSVTGKVQWHKKVPELLATDIVKGSMDVPEEIIPIYPEMSGLNSKLIRTIVKQVLPQAESYFPEFLPEGEHHYLPRAEAYREIHFPSSLEALKRARERLVIEEILFLQLALAQLRSPLKKEKGPALNQGGELVKKFLAGLPFTLTKAQIRVIKEIFRDMADDSKAMTRLLQGDVGSGKTAVAMTAMLQAAGSGYQAAMMAPTEVLARQHYQNLGKAFVPLGIEVVLLAGGQSKQERDLALSRISSGQAKIVVGTHAIIQEGVVFQNLGLVVTDEQHRFGVRQRTMLQQKGENPHVLVMTATPIPRTLALTLYGDLQLSVLNEMPPGRKPVITKKISDRNRPSLEKFLEQHISLGRQVYVVCPLVEETEKSDLVSATQTAEALSLRFPKARVALLHGRMKSQEKEEIMDRFRRGEIEILVTTTVVEVGVDVPNASIMVVEGAERFGLAQLHQLRGRVGRGEYQSYCILISNLADSSRLNILCHSQDGFRIAEEDLKIRGPGELLGLRQHGVPELKLTDLTKDGVLVEEAYRLLQEALNNPDKYEKLYREVKKTYGREKTGIN